MTDSTFKVPSLTDADVSWACAVLRLPETAFGGVDGQDPRLNVLKSTGTIDIEACPGSGKTTLLVAKLAILARKWTDSRRGLCVLSHTNVARQEIEQRLGNTPEGKRLLSYPHFVGTIHRFINEFLAMPWLRSLGYPIKVIDNSQCEQHRRRLLRLVQYSALANYVNPRESNKNRQINVVSNWRLSSPEFNVLTDSGEPEFKDPTKRAAMQLRALAERCLKDGYYRHDEMFMWAHDLLQKLPDVRDVLRTRFPMLFMDEVQDNSEEQSDILFRLFMEGDNPVLRQRFGDSNQAIYNHVRQTEGATTDRFPISTIRQDIPNSHRFSQEIGNLANPLAIVPQGLIGCGPPSHVIKSDTTGKNTIFLFESNRLDKVLATYATYLQEVFSEQELRQGTFAAIGGVHRPGGEDNHPRSVAQYWPDYDYELAGSEPKPSTFFQYLMAGRRFFHLSGETYHVVERIADGLLRLAHMAKPTGNLVNRRRKHRYVLDLLACNAEARATYLEIVTFLAIDQNTPTLDQWLQKWSVQLRGLAELIGATKVDSQEVAAFLEWQGARGAIESTAIETQRDNFFRYPAASPRVRIRVGSIHSVKGETHTATLVLETYYRGHHLSTLRPWLLGQKFGEEREGVINTSRLKQHYVAMTRPTHLLCLAMKEDGLAPGDFEGLRSRGWRLARVTDAAPDWI